MRIRILGVFALAIAAFFSACNDEGAPAPGGDPAIDGGNNNSGDTENKNPNNEEDGGGDWEDDIELDASYAGINANILSKKCTNCHGSLNEKTGNVVTASLEDLMGENGSKAIVIPRKPNESLLFTSVESGAMPLKGEKLTEDELDAIYIWILNGARAVEPPPQEDDDDDSGDDDDGDGDDDDHGGGGGSTSEKDL